MSVAQLQGRETAGPASQLIPQVGETTEVSLLRPPVVCSVCRDP